jgi:hypothetical protein
MGPYWNWTWERIRLRSICSRSGLERSVWRSYHVIGGYDSREEEQDIVDMKVSDDGFENLFD